MSDRESKPGIDPEEPRETSLAEPDSALYGFLESLLAEVDEAPAPAPPKVEVKTPETKPQTKTEPELKESTPPPLERKTTPTFPVEVEAANDLCIATEPAETAPPPVPEWAGQPFQSLVFEVDGMELAVPLVCLHSIAVWEEEATPMPGQPDWHLGVWTHRERKAVVLDTARLIMPERLKESAAERRQQHGSHLLVIGEGDWALRCDAIKGTRALTSDDIRWREQRTSRPWALGTLVEHLCVLLDVDALMAMVQQKQS